MKSLPASLALAAAAITQALGIYSWNQDLMAMAGQVFFPILFGLMAIFLAWRNKGSDRFYVPHAILAVLGVLALVATLIGMVGSVFALYPSVIVYYLCLVLIAIETALRIAALPKKKSQDIQARKDKRRRKIAGSGPKNLVAKSKSQGAAEPEGREDAVAE